MRLSNFASFVFGAGCLFCGLSLAGCGSTTTTSTSTSTSTTPTPADNYLFESYKFLSSVSTDTIQEVANKFFALKSECLRDNEQVVASVSGGLQNAPETALNGQGYEEGFVATFQSEADRAFYDGSCTARTEFKAFVGPLIDDVVPVSGVPAYNPGVLVFDYTGEAGGDLVSPHTVHMCFFRFKQDVSSETKADVMARFLDLKDACVMDGKTVVEVLTAGDATSVKTADQLYSQGYYVQFGSPEDRDFYIGCPETPCQLGGTPLLSSYCHAHDDFKVYAGQFFETEQVIPAPTPGSTENAALNYAPGRFSFNFIASEETSVFTV